MRLLVAGLLVAFAAGCLGDLPTEQPIGPDATARQLFDQNVQPVVAGKCATCHTEGRPQGNITGFVDPDAAQAYATLTGYTAVVGDFTAAGAPMLALIKAGHQGQSYSSDQEAKIVAWLAKELDERGQPPDPGDPIARALNEWSGCQSLDNFRLANMVAWGNENTENAETCANCHATGGFGHIASDAEGLYFNAITEQRRYMGVYFYFDPTTQAIAINRTAFEAVANGYEPHLEHPRFNLEGSAGMAALEQYFQLTTDRKLNGLCDAPRLK